MTYHIDINANHISNIRIYELAIGGLIDTFFFILENVTIDCSNISTIRIVNTTLSYYSITSNGVSRIRVPPTSDNERQFENYNQARKSLEKRVCKKGKKMI